MPSIYHHSSPFVELAWVAHADVTWETGYGVHVVGTAGGVPVVSVHGLSVHNAEQLVAELQAAITRVRAYANESATQPLSDAGTPSPAP